MSQIHIVKRAVIVVFVAGVAATILAPRAAPASAFHAINPALPPIDHGAILTQSSTPVAPRHKSPLRILPAETPSTSITLVGLRAKA